MARGTIKGSFSGTAASNVYPQIEWSSSSNTANNTSSVTAVLYFVRASSYWKPYNLNGHSVAISINGNSGSANRKIDLRNTSKYEVWRRTVTVAHGSDGKKSINIKASSGSTGINLGSYSVSGTAKLDTIPRASTFITDKITYDMDSQVIMLIRAAASGFTHKVWINYGSKRILVLDNPATGVNVHFTPKLSDFASQIASATSGNGSFELETYSGSTKIGSYKQTRYLTIPASVVPTTSNFTISDGNAKAQAVLGGGVNFVQQSSILNIAISAAGTYGSWITTSETVIGGKTYTSTANSGRSVSINLNELSDMVGTQTVKVRTKDSRGRWSSYATQNINIWAYEPPTISAAIERVSNTTKIKFTKSAKVSSIKISNVEKNTYTAVTEYKASTDTTWTTAKTETNSFATVTIDGFAIDKSYDIRLTLTDKFTSTSTMTNISTSKVLLDLYRDVGVGVGKLYETGKGTLDVGGDVTIENGSLNLSSSSQSVKLSADDGMVQRDNDGFFIQIMPNSIGMNNPEHMGGKLTAETLHQLNSVGTLLWSGNALMMATQTAKPTTPMSECLNGWVLLWSELANGATASNSRFFFQYIPKWYATTYGGAGVTMVINAPANGSNNDLGVATKYLYIWDDHFKGYAGNTPGNGLGYTLREVRAW